MFTKAINLFVSLMATGQIFCQDKIVEFYKGLQLKGSVKSVKQRIYEVNAVDSLTATNIVAKYRTTNARMEVIKGEESGDVFYYVHINKKGLPDSTTFLNEEGRQYNFTLYEYDEKGNITRAYGKDALTSINVEVDKRYNYQYDTAGNIAEKVAFIYDKQIWYEKYSYTFFSGNGIKKLTIKRDYDKEKLVHTQHFNYDEDGRIVEYKRNLSGEEYLKGEKYLVDSSVRYIKNWEYDAKGRLIYEKENIIVQANRIMEIRYDYSKGTRSAKLTNEDGTRLYAYDSLGKILSYKLINSDGFLLRDFSFTYEMDENDNWVRRYWFDNIDNRQRFCTEREIEYYKQWEPEKPEHCLLQ
ncbi:MAG: hypothetical protein HOP10_08600 [Chitinophagaceae bacterium]|nr:hypothetical protein [Chitinophagaceae bacterium]